MGCIGLVSIALYFANAMTFELRASDNRASGLATDQAIEGAARYVGYVLANFATNGTVPLKTQYHCAAVPIGDALFLAHWPRSLRHIFDGPAFRPG